MIPLVGKRLDMLDEAAQIIGPMINGSRSLSGFELLIVVDRC
jgi:hypothetical protein